MYFLLKNVLPDVAIIIIGALCCLAGTYLWMRFPPQFLPRDHGRAFAVNGELSKGKLRGTGLLMIVVLLVAGLVFLPLTREYLVFEALVFLMMLSGFLDDAAQNPWSDYKKGAIDLIISVIAVASFLQNNPPDIMFFGQSIHLHPVVYGILGVILIWVSVNVTNCSDGVDGLCGSVSLVAMAGYALIFTKNIGNTYVAGTVFFIAVLLAYLRFNWSPSTILMGDAGSRAIGIWLAMLAMKSGHPFSFLLMGLVFLIDGGLGLVKVFIMRFFKIPFLTKIRFPLHDQMRKNMGMKDVPVVIFWICAQVVMTFITFLVER